MSHSVRLFIVIAALSGSLLACEEDAPMPTPPGPWPTPTAGSPAVPSVRPTTTSLVVENRYPRTTITALYLSLTRKESWGSNQLSRAIQPGQRFTLSGIPCDNYYDLKLTASGGSQLRPVIGIYFACGYEKVVSLNP